MEVRGRSCLRAELLATAEASCRPIHPVGEQGDGSDKRGEPTAVRHAGRLIRFPAAHSFEILMRCIWPSTECVTPHRLESTHVGFEGADGAVVGALRQVGDVRISFLVLGCGFGSIQDGPISRMVDSLACADLSSTNCFPRRSALCSAGRPTRVSPRPGRP